MNSDLKKALKTWWRAHVKAQDNPRLLIKNNARYSDLCTRRMSNLGLAQTTLDAFEDEPGEFPATLANWWKTRHDPGCPHCWLTSGPIKHPECKEKIENWFNARTALAEFVANL